MTALDLAVLSIILLGGRITRLSSATSSKRMTD
jgi:hypothetical protein